jgi:LPPG:FO 2-phospho-L-lactate transferase
MRVVCLAGGVGGAKLADGLQQILRPGELTVVVNTGDDLERHGLTICPDHDTVACTRWPASPTRQGWGIAGETWPSWTNSAGWASETWFRLGDRDLATHIYRTERLRRRERPTEVALELADALGVIAHPADDDGTVRTRVRTQAAGSTSRTTSCGCTRNRRCSKSSFDGAAKAPADARGRRARSARPRRSSWLRPTRSSRSARSWPCRVARRDRRRPARGVPAIGVSGIVGGKALRGPADR